MLVIAAAMAIMLGVALVLLMVDRDTAADFEFTTYQGEETLGNSRITFSHVLGQGKAVVLNFWGGDCPPCRAEMPAFEKISRKYADELVFIGIDVGAYTGLGTRNSALALLEELGITYPVGAPVDQTVLNNYGIDALPITLFYGAGGKLVNRWDGSISEERADAIVLSLLSER